MKNKEIIGTIDFTAKKQSSPRYVIGRKMAILKVPFKKDDEYKRENLSGLYTHQIAFINATLDMVFANKYNSVVYNTVVSSGKTTSIVSLAYALRQIVSNMEDKDKKTLIYTTWSPNNLKELFIKCKEIGLNVLSAFATNGGRIVIKSASNINTRTSTKAEKDKSEITLDDIVNYDILICHPLTLMKLFARMQSESTDDDHRKPVGILGKIVVALDELNSGKINSVPEHVIGSLIGFLDHKNVHKCILSASIQKNKHINYLSRSSKDNHRKMKLIESSNILIPTIVRQFTKSVDNGRSYKPMSIFGNASASNMVSGGND